MAELDFEVTDEVDITDKVCPLTFVKAKVAIEELVMERFWLSA